MTDEKLQAEVDKLSEEMAENHDRLAGEKFPPDVPDVVVDEAAGLTLMNPERFSPETIGHDGRAFVALAMEGAETSIQGTPFSEQITIETRRSRVVLSFESHEAAVEWLEAQSSAILGPRYEDAEP